MRRAPGPWLAMLVAVGLVMPTTIDAAIALWTLVGSPLTAQVGASTTFTLTATNEDPLGQIGCVVVTTTSSFHVDSTAIVNGIPWTIGDSQSHTKVTAQSTTSGGALGLAQSVIFTVTATPLATGAFNWTGTAYQDINCGGTPLTGIPVVAIVVTSVAATSPATPAPTAPPSPAPTPGSTPTPSPSPTPAAGTSPSPTSKPTSAPAASGSATPAASSPPVPGSQASGSPDPSETAAAPDPTNLGTGSGQAGAGPASGPGLGAPREGDQFIVSSRGVEIDGDLSAAQIGMQPILTLAVPAILLAGPGLPLILAFAAQVSGALAWLPIVRRHMGERAVGRNVRFARRTGGS